MPLNKSKSKSAFSQNVRTEMKSGKPQKQALAIAYSVMRHNKRKKMAEGGMVENEVLHPMHEPGLDDSTSIQRDSIQSPPNDNLKEMYMDLEERPMSSKAEMEDMPGGMLGMDAKSIVRNLRTKMAEGGEVQQDPKKMEDAQASMRKAFHFAEGGEVEGLDDDHINSGFMKDDFLSQDSEPMPEDLSRSSNMIQAEDEDPQKKRLTSIMNALRMKHMGK